MAMAKAKPKTKKRNRIFTTSGLPPAIRINLPPDCQTYNPPGGMISILGFVCDGGGNTALPTVQMTILNPQLPGEDVPQTFTTVARDGQSFTATLPAPPTGRQVALYAATFGNTASNNIFITIGISGGPTGPTGPTGPSGPTGISGPTGGPGGPITLSRKGGKGKS